MSYRFSIGRPNVDTDRLICHLRGGIFMRVALQGVAETRRARPDADGGFSIVTFYSKLEKGSSGKR